MSASEPITADTLLTDMIEQHPETIQVFLQRRLYCVGCVISPFHTVADTAREHGVGLQALLGDLNQVLRQSAGDPRA